MNPIFQQAVFSVIRSLLIAAATKIFVSRGIWSQSDMERYVEAGTLAVIAWAWSYRHIVANRVKFLVGLMPGPTTEEAVDAHIASGAATPATNTPRNTVPGVTKP